VPKLGITLVNYMILEGQSIKKYFQECSQAALSIAQIIKVKFV